MVFQLVDLHSFLDKSEMNEEKNDEWNLGILCCLLKKQYWKIECTLIFLNHTNFKSMPCSSF